MDLFNSLLNLKMKIVFGICYLAKRVWLMVQQLMISNSGKIEKLDLPDLEIESFLSLSLSFNFYKGMDKLIVI